MLIVKTYNVNCPYCKAELTILIGEVFYGKEIVKREYCHKCGECYFVSLELIICAETYRIREEARHANE